MATNQKLTAKQKSERSARRGAEQRRNGEAPRQEDIHVVVCVILVLALGIPTMALMVMGGDRRTLAWAHLPCSVIRPARARRHAPAMHAPGPWRVPGSRFGAHDAPPNPVFL
ncbi:MAG: hypothetical protein ACLSVD_11845 [Eggerthellaceae bacterium]